MRTLLQRLRARCRNWSFDDDLREELRVHEEMKREELLASGLPPDGARAAARRALGNVTLMREESRRVWIAPWIESVVLDARYAARSLARQPLLATVMIAVLAFGIGLPATMFNLFKGIALDPWPVRDPGEIVIVRARAIDGQGLAGPSVDEYRFLREHLASMQGLAAHSRVGSSARLERTGRAAVSLSAVWVSSNFFDVVGVPADTGRVFVPADDRLAADRSPLIISDAAWQRHFDRDPHVLGEEVAVGGHAFVVVGVLPAGFDGIGREVHLWMPLTTYAAVHGADEVAWEGERASVCCINVVGRLADGVSLQSARHEVQVVHEQFAKTLNRQAGRAQVFGTAEMSRPGGMGSGMAVVGAFSGAVALILVLACANVGNLQLARAFARKRELATRLSIGASRRRVVRQLLTEGFVLALFAGAGGVVIAALLPKLVFVAIDERPSEYLTARLVPDGELVAFTFLMCVAACLAFALMPALHATRLRIPLATLDRASTRRSRLPLRGILLATQVAACTALIAGAVLLTRAITHALAFDPGFAVEDVQVVTPVFPSGTHMAHRRATAAAVLQAAESAASAPVALAEINPFSDVRYVMWLSIPGGSSLEGVLRRNVSTRFFEVLGVPLSRGRMFDSLVPGEAVVNEAFARTYLPAADILGSTFDVVNPRREREGSVTVVGVLPDVHLAGLAGVQPVIFTAATSGMFLTRNDPASVEGIRATLASHGAGATVRPLRATIVQALEPSIVGAGMAWTLGLLALALAAVGIFGVFAYAVEERRREIGVRLALGAARAHIVRMLVSTSGRAIAVGLGSGLLLSLACGPVLRSYLFGLHPLDPIAYAGVLALLGGIAALATAIPARRAMRVDPAITLREE
jgi:predicted permease